MREGDPDSSTERKFESKHMEINIKDELGESDNSDDKFAESKQEDTDIEYKVEIIPRSPPPEFRIKTFLEHMEINIKAEPGKSDNSDDKFAVKKQEDTDVEYKVEIIPQSPPPELHNKTCLEEPSLLCEDQTSCEEETNFSSLNRKFGVKNSGEISKASDTSGLNIDTNESFTSYCNKVLSLQTSLDTHEQVSKSTLFENIFKDTSKNRQLSCGVCNKPFLRKDHLVNHMRMHTGQKPYFCDICKKAFSLKSSLYTHERIHTGQRPYICEHCKKTFSHKHNLKVHLSIHTGQRPYICEICNKSFSYRSTLKKHNMRAHVRM